MPFLNIKYIEFFTYEIKSYDNLCNNASKKHIPSLRTIRSQLCEHFQKQHFDLEFWTKNTTFKHKKHTYSSLMTWNHVTTYVTMYSIRRYQVWGQFVNDYSSIARNNIFTLIFEPKMQFFTIKCINFSLMSVNNATTYVTMYSTSKYQV